MEKIFKKKHALRLLNEIQISYVNGYNGAKKKEFLIDTDMLEKWLQKKMVVINLKHAGIESIPYFEVKFFDNFKKYYLEKNNTKVSHHFRIFPQNTKNFEAVKNAFESM